MLTHEAYLDTLRAMRSTNPTWQSTLAGYLVLRLIDGWLDEDAVLVCRDQNGLQAVCETLSQVSQRDPAQPLLRELVDIVTQTETRTTARLEPLMIRYGRLLFQQERWQLALDVFASLMSHSLASHEISTAVSAAIRLAYVFKELGQVGQAEDTYQFVFQNSSPDHTPELYWLGQVGFSDMLALRGQAQEARIILDTMVTATRARGLDALYEDALCTRCSHAMERQDYRTAVRVGVATIPHISDPRKRHRLRTNIGAGFVGCGEYDAAKQILLPELEQPDSEIMRQNILLNLLEIAVQEGDQTALQRYDREIAPALTRPMALANYYLYTARNHYNLDDIAHAREGWRNALAISADSGLIQIHRTIQAEIVSLGQNLHL